MNQLCGIAIFLCLVGFIDSHQPEKSITWRCWKNYQGHSGTIVSSANDENMKLCNYHIEAKDDKRLRLTVNYPKSNPSEDILVVFDGKDCRERKAISVLTPNSKPVVTSGDEATLVHLRSSGKGKFSVEYKSVNSKPSFDTSSNTVNVGECGAELEGNTGKIRVSDYLPSNVSNTVCIWKVESRNHRPLRLRFKDHKMPGTFQAIWVLDGEGCGGRVLAHSSGESIKAEAELDTQGSSMIVIYQRVGTPLIDTNPPKPVTPTNKPPTMTASSHQHLLPTILLTAITPALFH